MIESIKEAWRSLSPKGKGIVAVVLILVVGALLAYTMFLNYDWSWLGGLF
jgi:hypothetical protein